jgi:hypothetical protein
MIACHGVFAGQSVQVSEGSLGVALPFGRLWESIGSNNQTMRWEMRVHGFGQGNLPSKAILLGGGISVEARGQLPQIQAGNAGSLDALANNGPVAKCCVGHNDVLIRVQRDVSRKKLQLEVWDTHGSYYETAEAEITEFGRKSWADTTIQINPGVDVAFLRWFSTVVEPGTPIAQTGTKGDLGDWEFEGDARDSSGHKLDLRGRSVSYVPSPSYAPNCDAGAQRSFRAGFAAELNASASVSDSGGKLEYAWRQLSGPHPVIWSNDKEVRPTITGLVPGTYLFQLTVSDESGQSSTCAVKDGVVMTDDHDVVITNNKPVDTLLGPLIRWGKNTWPWYDDRHKAAADIQKVNLDKYYGAYWDAPSAGTVTVTVGSATVVGAGTAFKKTFCGGGSTYKGTEIIVWYPTGLLGKTGRRRVTPKTCLDDTHMLLSAAWTGDVSGGSGLNYSICDYSQPWDYQNGPANFYDNVAAFYNLYYRSGIDDYLYAARKLADRYWTSPNMDRGMACNINGNSVNCPGFIYRVTLGLVLRALDGRPDMWEGLHYLWKLDDFYIREYYPSLHLAGIPDARANGYLLMDLSYCAMYDPDPAFQALCKTDLRTSFSTLWTPAIQPDGGLPQLYVGTVGGPGFNSSWYTKGSTTAVMTRGSSIATGKGNPWTKAMFEDCIGQGFVGCPIWFTNSASNPPPVAGGGDDRVYYATYIDANHLTLHDIDGKETAYKGNTGVHGWASGDSGTVGTVGWESQPYAIGLLAFGFDMAANALAPSDPSISALARRYNIAAANWIRKKGYSPEEKGLYYISGYVNCIPPIPKGTRGCLSDTRSARALNAEALRGLIAAYRNNGDPALRSLIDTMYSAMWSKPATGGPNPDGMYIIGMNDDGFYLTGVPPVGQSPKYFGQFFGVNSLSNWPAIRTLSTAK